MRVSHFPSSHFVAAVSFIFAAGCGGATSEAKAPPIPSSTVSPALGAPKNAPMLESSTIGRAQADFDEASRGVELSGNDCAQLCKALSSMSRAAERLCELAKDGGEDGQRRCTDARVRLEVARTRVRDKCPGCEPS